MPGRAEQRRLSEAADRSQSEEGGRGEGGIPCQAEPEWQRRGNAPASEELKE